MDDVYAATIEVPFFTPGVRDALAAAGMSLFRVPAYRDAPAQARVRLLAASTSRVQTKISYALAGVARPVFVAEPWLIGGRLEADGLPENDAPADSQLAALLHRAARYNAA